MIERWVVVIALLSGAAMVAMAPEEPVAVCEKAAKAPRA
jgi:hypothetical protein